MYLYKNLKKIKKSRKKIKKGKHKKVAVKNTLGGFLVW